MENLKALIIEQHLQSTNEGIVIGVKRMVEALEEFIDKSIEAGRDTFDKEYLMMFLKVALENIPQIKNI